MTKNNYDPNQPRVPGGHPTGGQWTRDGSGAGSSARKAAGLKTPRDKFVDEIGDLNYEKAGLFDSEGNLIFEETQGHGTQVLFTREQLQQMRENELIHNHPGDDAPFSISDIKVMVDNKIAKSTVIASEYIYTMEMKTNLDFGREQMPPVLDAALSRWDFEITEIELMSDRKYKMDARSTMWEEIAAWATNRVGVEWIYTKERRVK